MKVKWHRHGKTPHHRFMENIQEDENECWVWQGTKNHRGYGVITVDNKKVPAHRYSWSYYNTQSIPDGYYICHSCDNPSCVNPVHLFLGTQYDNMQDMVRKGRNSDTRGENNPRASIYDEGVLQIRKMWDTGISAKEIAVHFCIPINTVRNITSNVTWRHLPLCKRKASNRGSHLQERDIQEMRRLYGLGVSSTLLGKMFRLTQQQAWKVVNYWSFKDIK